MGKNNYYYITDFSSILLDINTENISNTKEIPREYRFFNYSFIAEEDKPLIFKNKKYFVHKGDLILITHVIYDENSKAVKDSDKLVIIDNPELKEYFKLVRKYDELRKKTRNDLYGDDAVGCNPCCESI